MNYDTQKWPILSDGIQIGFVTREQYLSEVLWSSRAMDGTNCYTSGSRAYAQTAADVICQIKKYSEVAS